MFTTGDLERVLKRTTLAADDPVSYYQTPDITAAAVDAGVIDSGIHVDELGGGSSFRILLGLPIGITLATDPIDARKFEPPIGMQYGLDGPMHILETVMREVNGLKRDFREQIGVDAVGTGRG